MHIALYRKYRPKTFSEVIGQKYVVRALKNQVAEGKIGHAFIFTGTRGTGKTSCAKIFAKAVNCLHPVNGEPCLECEVCKGIENESIFDVTEMDAASNNSVEDIRDVLNEVNYLPVMAKYRVYIIDEVHMLSIPAFNALLKTLEEPPAHVIFILATTEIHKVPATILSRCQRYDFTKLTIDEIAGALLDIAGKEGIDLTEPAAKLIASLSDGAMRDANSILETCIAGGRRIDEDLVANITGVSREDDIFDFVRRLSDMDAALSLQKLMELTAASVDLKRLCEELISHFTGLLVASLNGSTAQLLNVSQEKFDRLSTQAKSLSADFISSAISRFSFALENISKGQNPKVAMDIAVYNLCCGMTQVTLQPRQTRPAPSVSPRPRPRAQRTPEQKEKPVSHQPEQNISQPARPIRTPVSDMPVEFEQWQQVIDEIADVDIPLHSFIKNSRAWLYGGVVYIKGNESLNKYIRENKDVNAIIKKAIAKVCGRVYNIGGFKNIAHMFRQEQHSSLDDILALRERGVQVDIKD